MTLRNDGMLVLDTRKSVECGMDEIVGRKMERRLIANYETTLYQWMIPKVVVRTQIEVDIYNLIMASGPMTRPELSEKLDKAHSTLFGAIRRLEENGLVERISQYNHFTLGNKHHDVRPRGRGQPKKYVVITKRARVCMPRPTSDDKIIKFIRGNPGVTLKRLSAHFDLTPNSFNLRLKELVRTRDELARDKMETNKFHYFYCEE